MGRVAKPEIHRRYASRPYNASGHNRSCVNALQFAGTYFRLWRTSCTLPTRHASEPCRPSAGAVFNPLRSSAPLSINTPATSEWRLKSCKPVQGQRMQSCAPPVTRRTHTGTSVSEMTVLHAVPTTTSMHATGATVECGARCDC